MKVPRVALPAPRVQMQGEPTQTMPKHRRGGATQQVGLRRPQPEGRQGFAPAGLRFSSSSMTKHRFPPPALPANADPWRAAARDFYHGLLRLRLRLQITGRPRRITREPSTDIEELEAEDFVFAIQEQVMAANRIEQLLSKASSISELNSYVEGMGFDV